jgi:hypothetical protein
MATLTTTIQYSEPAGTIITALGVPGPSGPGVPVGGAAGQILAKIDSADYNTHWVTPQDDSAIWGQITGDIANQLDLSAALSLKLDVSTAASTYQTLSGMSAYLAKAGNLAGLTDLAAARDNLQLGALNSPVFASVSIQGSGSNLSNLTPTSLSLNQSGFGQFTISPSQGIVFPDSTVQVTAYTGDNVVSWGEIDGQISNQSDLATALDSKYPTSNPSGFINSSALAPYLTSADAATTYAITARGLPIGGNTAQVLTKSSNVDYASTWTTIIPGDRYLTSSTTPNTVSNGAKTFAVQTGLSYTPTQDVTISYDSNNHMHAVVTSYNTATGILVVNVNHHTGSGTYSSWVVNVGGTVPAQTVAWGSITGTISSQLDLQEQLDTKLNTATAASTYYLQTNPAGFITSSALAPYLLASTAASTYLTQANAASTYFTISSAAGKANLSGATFTGKINLATINAASPSFNLGGQCDSAPASATNGDVWVSNAASPKLTYRAGGINFNVPVLNQFNTFTGQMVINTTSTSVPALDITQSGAGGGLRITNNGIGNTIYVDNGTPDVPFAVGADGKVGIGVAPDANAALKVDGNGIMFGDGTTQYTAAGSPGSIPNNPSLEKIWFIFNYFNYITSWSYDSIYNQTTVYHTGPDSAIRSFSNGFYLTDGNYTFGLNNNETPGVIIWNGDITDGGLGRNLYVKNGDSFLQQITKYFN